MSQLKHKQCWVFDMDGTLTRAIHDFDAMRDALELPVGVPILEALAAMEPEQAKAKHQQLDEMELDIAAQAEAQAGCHELLDLLKSKDVRLGIVTRNGRQIADATLKAAGIDSYFKPDCIVSRDCCEPKPDPAGILLLLDRWSASAADTVMTGDYLFDLEAGHTAGTTTVHLDVQGRFPWPEITDIEVKSLTDLRALIS